MSLIIATILREEGVTGVHTHVRQLQRYLAKQDMAAALVTPSSRRRLMAAPVFGVSSVLRWCSGSATVVWYLYWHEAFLRNALRRRLAEVGECVVYAQSPTAARAALRARYGPHQRVVMAVHFMTSYADEFAADYIKKDGKVFQAIRQFERETIPLVDGIVYVSNAVRSALLAWLPEAVSAPSAVINNFVASSSSSPCQEPCGDLVSIGALRPLKNHRFLLEILSEVKRTGRSITLDVFGDGPSRKELEQLTRSLGLENQVRWRGFRQDVRKLMSGYKIYVHTSYSEAHPLAIVEAMAAGLPIIAGDVGGISEMGDNGLEIRFWPLDDPAKAAAVLLELLDCEPLRLKAASAAASRFKRDFDADVVGARLLAFLLGGTDRSCGTSKE
jgi:glycosyltransferase involved in cell wall biosynthesis